MIGEWLNDQTPVQAISDFAEKVFLRKDLGGFKGDPRFVQNDYAARSFSHWRSCVAGLYAWRAEHAASEPDRARMTRAADSAFRQAFALCPYVPEVVSRCTNFFKSQNRTADALLIAKTAARLRSELKLDAAKSAEHAAQAPKPPVFQMRLVLDAPSDDAERMTLVSENTTGGQPHLETLYVQKQVLLDKAAVQSAKVASDPRGAPQIEIIFTDEGRKRFAEVTRENLHKRLAIIFDGRIRCAPVIQTEISGGRAEISGAFTDQEAETLARKINDAIGK
jgi:hypothetical protein